MKTKRILELLEFILNNEGDGGAVTKKVMWDKGFSLEELNVCALKGLIIPISDGYYIGTRGLNFINQNRIAENTSKLNAEISRLHKDIETFAINSKRHSWAMVGLTVAMLILVCIQVWAIFSMG